MAEDGDDGDDDDDDDDDERKSFQEPDSNASQRKPEIVDHRLHICENP